MTALHKIAIVNRGEAALRLIRAVREYNLERGSAIETVALLTPPDADSPVARTADDTVMLPVPEGRLASAAYLDIDAVMAAIGEVGAPDSDFALWVDVGAQSNGSTETAPVSQAVLTL